MKNSGKPWVLRLPQGLRDQTAWVFIGIMCALAGFSYLLGIAESNAITQVLEPIWLRVWGGFLFSAGSLVAFSTFVMNRALERFSMRLLSLGMLVYMGWILTAAPLSRATLTVVLCLILVGLAEIRAAVIKVNLRPLPVVITEVSE